jgi:hypothetical protein
MYKLFIFSPLDQSHSWNVLEIYFFGFQILLKNDLFMCGQCSFLQHLKKACIRILVDLDEHDLPK